jgi:hypothetical protein
VSRRITLAWLSDAASIAVAYPTRRKLGEFMPEAIRTRCKFRVVSVELTDNAVSKRVFEDSVTPEDYAALVGTEYTDNGKKVKYISTGKFAQNVRLAAQYDTSNPEDVSFAAATPSGTMTFLVDNPDVCDTFVPGKSYYLDLTPCE